jgi:HEAT repeat protein
MSSISDPKRQPPPPEQLPPVEAPDATFIIQLFVVPGVIVAIIVLVWTLFNWLAQMGNDPLSYVKALDRNNQARWQSAVNLADALREPGNSALKSNTEVATKLAEMLEREIEAAHNDDKTSLQLRVYLCHALGEFTVPQVLPALIKAAGTQRAEDERYVRFAALKGLTVFLSGQPSVSDALRTQLRPVMLKAADDPETLVRSTAAFGLGALGDDESGAKLKQMLADKHPNVRYNAATMLASHGDLTSEKVLAEMLGSKPSAASEPDSDEAALQAEHTAIVVNAMRATAKLATAQPQADLTALRAAIKQLSTSDPSKQVKLESAALLSRLEQLRKQ